MLYGKHYVVYYKLISYHVLSHGRPYNYTTGPSLTLCTPWPIDQLSSPNDTLIDVIVCTNNITSVIVGTNNQQVMISNGVVYCLY